MRQVILQEFVSLDGMAAGPNDSVDFVPASTRGDRPFGHEQLALMDTIDAILLGRKTYSMFAGYWPNVTEGDEKPFAEKINALPKIVFSKTLDRAPWGSWAAAHIVRTSPAEEVKKLKQHSGKPMVLWGSLSLAQSLIDAGLIDEYRLVVCPVVLGGGRALFRESGPSIAMKLQDARALLHEAQAFSWSSTCTVVSLIFIGSLLVLTEGLRPSDSPTRVLARVAHSRQLVR